jgi:hypothetical protein
MGCRTSPPLCGPNGAQARPRVRKPSHQQTIPDDRLRPAARWSYVAASEHSDCSIWRSGGFAHSSIGQAFGSQARAILSERPGSRVVYGGWAGRLVPKVQMPFVT